jgi:hypothetical protein
VPGHREPGRFPWIESGGVTMNFLLVAMVVLTWFLMSHHSLFVHAP